MANELFAEMIPNLISIDFGTVATISVDDYDVNVIKYRLPHLTYLDILAVPRWKQILFGLIRDIPGAVIQVEFMLNGNRQKEVYFYSINMPCMTHTRYDGEDEYVSLFIWKDDDCWLI